MELIKITEQNGKKVVSARELHTFLEVETPLTTWAKRMFEYGFIENVDFQRINKSVLTPNGGEREALDDYALTLEMAKHLAMIQRSNKGMQARNYFIDCEKQLQKPMSQLEILVQSVRLLEEQSKRIDSVEAKILELQNKPQINAPIEHFSIMGYCRNIHKQISIEEAKTYGAKCRKMCNELGMVIGKVPDPRFGSVNTYPLDVLSQIIKN